jgi:predicted ATPase
MQMPTDLVPEPTASDGRRLHAIENPRRSNARCTTRHSLHPVTRERLPCRISFRCDQGRHAEARDLLAPVYGWFTEGFDSLDLKEAKALLDQLA